MLAMAGAVAEAYMLSEENDGDAKDIAEVERLIPDDPDRRGRLELATWRLVERHAERIVALASALREHGTLEAGVADALVGF
jgi:MoxR-like ATPase